MRMKINSGKNYYRIMLGAKSVFAMQCFEEKWFGGGWNFSETLQDEFPDDWKLFNKKYIPKYLENNPGKSKVAAGLACGMLHTICKGIQIGDIVLCPDGKGAYWIGEVVSDYFYVLGAELPHRRRVSWFEKQFSRLEMSEELKRSTGSIGTVSNISKYSAEIDAQISGHHNSIVFSNDESVEDPSAFAMEKHLEDFLISNWASTELGKDYNIFHEDGEIIGQQYLTDTGPMDILAISKDKKELLVVELKKGRASDAVVGQALRYMGYIASEVAEPHQEVKGCIIALEDSLKLRNALKMTPNIEFYKYQVSFNLLKN